MLFVHLFGVFVYFIDFFFLTDETGDVFGTVTWALISSFFSIVSFSGLE